MKLTIQYKTIILAILVITSIQNSKASVTPCAPPTAAIDLDVNNVRARLLNGGDMFWDIFGTRNSSYEIPKNSGRNSAFTASLFFSAVDGGSNLYTAGQTYRQRGLDFWPGALNAMGEIDSVDCKDADKMYNVYGSEIINAKLGKGISYNMNRWGNSDFPFFDKNADGIYDPTIGDYPVYDINNPSIIPAQMISWVFNDKGNVHTAFPGASAIGIEIQATASAYTSNTSLVVNNSTIYRFVITNKSNNSYTDFRFGKFVDFDLGNAADDYLGCDLSTNANASKRNLFFVYNSDDNDEDGGTKGYGLAPPAFGISFLNPGKTSNGTTLEMNSYVSISNSGQPGVDSDPRDALELHRYLQGLWPDGQPITYGTPTGRGGTDPCKFMFPGTTDLQGRPNWTETAPAGDRRGIVTVQPRSFAPGEKMTIELAYVWARDTPGTNLTSLAKLRLSTDTLIEAYKTNFSSFSTGIASSKNNKAISIYPNPANTFINLEAIGLVQDIKIFNSQGKLIMHINKPSNTRLNIESLPQGTYILKADNYVGRFVKM